MLNKSSPKECTFTELEEIEQSYEDQYKPTAEEIEEAEKSYLELGDVCRVARALRHYFNNLVVYWQEEKLVHKIMDTAKKGNVFDAELNLWLQHETIVSQVIEDLEIDGYIYLID